MAWIIWGRWGGEASFKERKEAFQRQGCAEGPWEGVRQLRALGFRHMEALPFRIDAGIPPDFLQTPSVPSLDSQELGIMRLVRPL